MKQAIVSVANAMARRATRDRANAIVPTQPKGARD